MRITNSMKVLMAAGILLFISQMAARTMSLLWILFTVLILFFVVSVLKICRRRENLWLFIYTAICGIPINLAIVKERMVLFFFDSGIPIVGTIIATVEVFLLLFAIEEIVVGVIGRIIWRRQYRITIEQ